MYRVQRHANQEGFLRSTADFQVKEKGILHLLGLWQPGIHCRKPVRWEWLIRHRHQGSVFPHPPSTVLRGLFPSADTPRDTFKSEIIVAKYIFYTALNYLPLQVSFRQHKGYAVSYSWHSTRNNTSGNNALQTRTGCFALKTGPIFQWDAQNISETDKFLNQHDVK